MMFSDTKFLRFIQCTYYYREPFFDKRGLKIVNFWSDQYNKTIKENSKQNVPSISDDRYLLDIVNFVVFRFLKSYFPNVVCFFGVEEGKQLNLKRRVHDTLRLS